MEGGKGSQLRIETLALTAVTVSLRGRSEDPWFASCRGRECEAPPTRTP